jgi:hypothetical protein
MLPLIPDAAFEEEEGVCVAVLSHDGKIEGVDLQIVGAGDLHVEKRAFRGLQVAQFTMQPQIPFKNSPEKDQKNEDLSVHIFVKIEDRALLRTNQSDFDRL